MGRCGLERLDQGNVTLGWHIHIACVFITSELFDVWVADAIVFVDLESTCVLDLLVVDAIFELPVDVDLKALLAFCGAILVFRRRLSIGFACLGAALTVQRELNKGLLTLCSHHNRNVFPGLAFF